MGWILTERGRVKLGIIGSKTEETKIRLDGGTFNNQPGTEDLMEWRRGGRGGRGSSSEFDLSNGPNTNFQCSDLLNYLIT